MMKVATFTLFTLLMTSSCSKAIPIKGVRASKVRVETTITTVTSGTVEANQQAVLSFGAPGRIGKVYKSAGDQVEKGDLIAEVENADLRAIQREASKDLKRTQEIFDKGLVAQASLDTVKKNYEVAQSNYEKSLIKAPFTGIITDLNLKKGEFFQSPATNPSSPPVRMIDFGARVIKGDIDEIDLGKVKSGYPARVKILSVRNDPFKAQVTRVIPFVKTEKDQDRTSQIELTLLQNDKPDLIIPVGASADVEVIVEARNQTLAIPTQTIFSKSGKHFTYVYQDGEIFERLITVGIGNYDRTEVLQGLTESETVVYPPENTELQDGLSVQLEMIPWP